MSPGCATRLRCADGTRAFVKAVGPELNRLTLGLFRHEVTVLEHLGADPLWASLLASYDEPGGWVALLLEDVEGRHPDLRDSADAALAIRATDRLVERLAGHGRSLPVGSARQAMARYDQMWPGLDEIPPDALPGWARKRAPAMQAALADLQQAAEGSHLVNCDIREDNLLVRPDGSLVFVDWGMSRVGAAWLDPLWLRLEWAEKPVFDDLVAGCLPLAALGDEAVTCFLYVLGVWLVYHTTVADDVGLPALARFRMVESARFLEGARRRLGIR